MLVFAYMQILVFEKFRMFVFWFFSVASLPKKVFILVVVYKIVNMLFDWNLVIVTKFLKILFADSWGLKLTVDFSLLCICEKQF